MSLETVSLLSWITTTTELASELAESVTLSCPLALEWPTSSTLAIFADLESAVDLEEVS